MSEEEINKLVYDYYQRAFEKRKSEMFAFKDDSFDDLANALAQNDKEQIATSLTKIIGEAEFNAVAMSTKVSAQVLKELLNDFQIIDR